MKKRYEIGSFFGKENNNYVACNDIYKDNSLNHLIKDNFYFFESGRSAISAIIEDVEKQTSNKVCLIPSYVCDTVVKPFTIKGWKVYFYQLNEKLEPIESELKRLVKKHKPSVIFLILYYGNDSIASMRKYLKSWEVDNEEHFCVEDLTQAFFYLKKLELGKIDKMKYQVSSMRKWFPVPDGGVANLYYEPNYITKIEPEYQSYQTTAQSLKGRYLDGEGVSKSEFLRLHRLAEDALDHRYEVLPMHKESYDYIAMMDWNWMYERRNENATFLKKKIDKIPDVNAFLECEKETAPLYVPILVEERVKFQEYMKQHDVFLPILWPIPKEVGKELNGFVKKVYTSMLAIPCDHRYTQGDMEYIVDLMKSYYERKWF